MNNEKAYLGDGVYVEWLPTAEVKLTTNDGMRDTNTIILEPSIRSALRSYMDKRDTPPEPTEQEWVNAKTPFCLQHMAFMEDHECEEAAQRMAVQS